MVTAGGPHLCGECWFNQHVVHLKLKNVYSKKIKGKRTFPMRIHCLQSDLILFQNDLQKFMDVTFEKIQNTNQALSMLKKFER